VSRAVARAAIAAAIVALATAALAQSPGPAPAPPTVAATIGGEHFVLELAADPLTMHQGLGGRDRIDPRGGMLFVYPRPQPLAFVMRDCPVPIDVAFLDPQGRVINLAEMEPEPPRRAGESAADYDARLPVHRSALPARYAVEVAGGRLRALGVAPGARVEIDWDALRAAYR
jgi:uncharacterized membrane protein (UPF0127 family)